MGFKHLKVFIGVALSVSALSGCSLFPGPVNRRSSNSEESLSATNNGVGGDVSEYQGDNSRDIGSYPNTPVGAYQQATLAKIRQFCDLGYATSHKREWFYNSTVDLMLSFGIGDQVACAFCDLALSMYGENGFNRPSTESSYMTEMVDYSYEALKILNSVDFNKAADFLDEWNRIYIEDSTAWQQERLDQSILEYYNPDLGISYNNLKKIKRHQSEFNNSDLNRIISAYDAQYNNFAFTDAQRTTFYNYQMSTREEIAQYSGLFPNEISQFLRDHANQVKPILIKNLKLILDANKELNAIAQEGLNYAYNGSNSNMLYIRNQEYGGKYVYNRENGFNFHNYMVKILEKRQVILGLLKSILANEAIGDLAIDVGLDLIIPLLRDNYPSNENNNRVLNNLTNKLRSLNGKHTTALCNFLLKLINQVYDEDIIDFLAYIYRADQYEDGEKSFDFNAFGDKYIGKLEEVIGSLTASDKSLINELLEVCGIDIFGEIDAFTRIFKNKNLSTESGQEAYHEALNEWLNSLGRKMENALALTYDENNDNNGGSSDNGPHYKEEQFPRIEVYIGEYLVQGDTAEELQNKLYINYYDRVTLDEYDYIDVDFSAPYNDWNNELARLRLEYENEREYYDYYASEWERTRMNKIMELPDVSYLTFDGLNTTNVGYIDLRIGFKFGNERHEFEKENIVVRPSADLPHVRFLNWDASYRFETDFGQNTNVYGSMYYNESDYSTLRCCMKNSQATLTFDRYEWEQNGSINLDTSKAGWNVAVGQMPQSTYSDYEEQVQYIFVYYVIDQETLNSHLVNQVARVGTCIEGADEFYNSPSVEYLYAFEGAYFELSYSLGFDESYVAGKAPNTKQTVRVDGIDYAFIIFSKDSSRVTEYNFYLNDYVNGDIRAPRTMSASVSVYYTCEVKIGNTYYYAYVSDYRNDEQLTNFTYVNGIASFNYDGMSFSFEVGSFN